MIYLIALPTIILFIYFAVILYLHQIELPTLKIEELIPTQDQYKILVIYPHPDDETMSVGGFINKYSNQDSIEIRCICTTKGSKGNEHNGLDEETLIEVRVEEYTKAMKLLGVNNYELWDFIDGDLKNSTDELTKKVHEEINTYKPDIVITFDNSGLYGHPDHIALSRIITEIYYKDKNFKLLYNTLPSNILKKIDLPLHMAEEEVNQTTPKYKLNIWKDLIPKYKAAAAHDSQKLGDDIPLWLMALLGGWEYFSEAD